MLSTTLPAVAIAVPLELVGLVVPLEGPPVADPAVEPTFAPEPPALPMSVPLVVPFVVLGGAAASGELPPVASGAD